MTYVVAAGVMYGEGENMFHSFFKSAWHGEQPGLKVFGDGQNVIPTIHVKDLARLTKECPTGGGGHLLAPLSANIDCLPDAHQYLCCTTPQCVGEHH